MTAKQLHARLGDLIAANDKVKDHEVWFSFDKPAFEPVFTTVNGLDVADRLPVYGVQPTMPVIVITNR